MLSLRYLAWLGVALAACGKVQAIPDAVTDTASDTASDTAVDAGMPDAPPGLNRQRVVYSAEDAAGIGQIFSMRLDGTDKKQITSEPIQTNFGAVSPDGKHIVYTTTVGTNEDLFVANFDGTGRRQLTMNAAADFRPAYSPDGLRIAFVSDRDTGSNIYVVTAADGDSGPVKRLTIDANLHTFPSMGANSKVTYSDFTTKEVMAVNEDGTGLINLTNNAANDTSSSYSRDGSKIAFSSDRASAGAFQIWMMNADGSHPVQLTTDATPDKFHASFDLTGEHVIYFAGATRNIYITAVDGSGTAPLTTDADKVSEKLGSWVIAE